jgi:hypothetical protein
VALYAVLRALALRRTYIARVTAATKPTGCRVSAFQCNRRYRRCTADESGVACCSPVSEIIANDTDWRFLNEVKRELWA